MKIETGANKEHNNFSHRTKVMFMKQKEIEAADMIIRHGRITSMSLGEIYSHSILDENARREVGRMAEYLEADGLINYVKGAHAGVYHLTPKGEQFQRTQKSYANYLEEKKQKSERDDYHKNLQIRELEAKLEVMNVKQLEFWDRQRWQFRLTITIAIISLILGITNFIRAC